MSSDASDPRSLRQIAMVFDLNNCVGCQTCSVACKMLWTREKGEEHQWWCTVSRQPGLGTPKGWEQMGGGYDADGNPVLGHMPTPEEFGGGWQFNHEEVFFGGRGRSAHLAPHANENGAPTWGPNWDEDQGGGEYSNAYYFYVPPLSPHRLNDDGSIDYLTPRIPPAYLESLFGPKVHAALDRLHRELASVRAGGKSEIFDSLIVYRWQELLGPFTKPPAHVRAANDGPEVSA